MTGPQTFRIRPFEVQAMQWDPGDQTVEPEVTRWLAKHNVAHHVDGIGEGRVLVLMESGTAAHAGYWVLRMPTGYAVAVRPELLAESYEPVEPS